MGPAERTGQKSEAQNSFLPYFFLGLEGIHPVGSSLLRAAFSRLGVIKFIPWVCTPMDYRESTT